MARPKEAILSKNLIRDQALAIIDEDGLDGLTMRRLATRLGVQAASLYTHFANKDAVLDAIGERLAKRIDPSGFDVGWREGLHTWATSYYVAAHWHPNAAAVLATGGRHRADRLAGIEQVRRELVAHGWPADHAATAASAVQFVVLGAATRAAGERADDTEPGPAGTDPLDQLAEGVTRDSFTLGLDSMLRGLATVYDEVRVDPTEQAPSAE